jgi:hypothetical protein
MPHTNQWNEASPAGTDLISAGDDEIRKFKLDVRERANLEHFWGVDLVQDGKHRHITLNPAQDVPAISGSNTMTAGGGLIQMSQTWNGNAHFDALKMDITDILSSADSNLIQMSVNGVPIFTVSKTGLITGGGGGSGGGDTVFNTPTVFNDLSTFNQPATFNSTAHFVGTTVFDQLATFNGGQVTNGTSTVNGSLVTNGNLTVNGDSAFHGNSVFDTGVVTFNTPVVFNGGVTFNPPLPGTEGSQAFPVGSVFLSIVATSPSTMLGYGIWVQFAQGRMLVGVNQGDGDFASPEQVGGEKAHILSREEMPSHSHRVTNDGKHTHPAHDNGHDHWYGSGWEHNSVDLGTPGTWEAAGMSGHPTETGWADIVVEEQSVAITIDAEGAGWAHNNLPPYIAVYMWKRTG